MIAALFRVGSAVTPKAPPRLRYGVASLAGRVAFAVVPGLRRQALANYAGVVRRPAEDPEVRRVASRAVQGYAKLMADFMLLMTATPDDVRRQVDVVGLDDIKAVLAKGKGAIVVMPHFGNWDMAAAAAVAHGLPVTAVTEHYGSNALNDLVVEARHRAGLKVVPLSVSAGKACLNALRRSEVVALVCDLPARHGKNVEVDVLGQRALVPVGPATLALRTGAPVVPAMCARIAGDRYRLEIGSPIEFTPSGDDKRDVADLSQAVMRRFEPVLERHPEQWYLFSPMWEAA